MSGSSLLSSSPSRSSLPPLTPGRQRLRSIELANDVVRANKRVLWIRAVAAEFTCTCIFMFLVCGSIMHCHEAHYNAGDSGLVVAFVNGFGATIMVYAFSDLSGAHFNPAVTFACWLAKKTSNRKLLSYIVAQCVSSSLSVALLLLIFPPTDQLLETIVIQPQPDVPLWRVFICEMILTMILVFMIFALVVEGLNTDKNDLTLYRSHGRSRQATAPLAIGFTVFVLCLIGGTISGGAFNPIRIFAPAIYTGRWTYIWVYWLAQFTGAGMGAALRHLFTMCIHKHNTTQQEVSEWLAQASYLQNHRNDEHLEQAHVQQYSPPHLQVVVP